MKPNVLFILLDAVSADKFYGNKKTSVTPNIDSLIKIAKKNNLKKLIGLKRME